MNQKDRENMNKQITSTETEYLILKFPIIFFKNSQ